MKHAEPTCYWVIRHDDDVKFDLVADRTTAERTAEQYEQDWGEPFHFGPEYRNTIPFTELPESWEHDWDSRVPNRITVTDVPDYALVEGKS